MVFLSMFNSAASTFFLQLASLGISGWWGNLESIRAFTPDLAKNSGLPNWPSASMLASCFLGHSFPLHRNRQNFWIYFETFFRQLAPSQKHRYILYFPYHVEHCLASLGQRLWRFFLISFRIEVQPTHQQDMLTLHVLLNHFP